MSKEHFSLLVKTLELEEKLANENFTNFSLDNIEKDNKNKMWTFNFSGKGLPSSEEFALFIQKLRESFQGEYLKYWEEGIYWGNKRVLEICNIREFFWASSSIIREYFIQ